MWIYPGSQICWGSLLLFLPPQQREDKLLLPSLRDGQLRIGLATTATVHKMVECKALIFLVFLFVYRNRLIILPLLLNELGATCVSLHIARS